MKLTQKHYPSWVCRGDWGEVTANKNFPFASYAKMVEKVKQLLWKTLKKRQGNRLGNPVPGTWRANWSRVVCYSDRAWPKGPFPLPKKICSHCSFINTIKEDLCGGERERVDRLLKCNCSVQLAQIFALFKSTRVASRARGGPMHTQLTCDLQLSLLTNETLTRKTQQTNSCKFALLL